MDNNQYLIPKIEQPFNVDLELPGSKSIALRQLAMSALTEGTTILDGVPVCDDTAAMLECLERLGLSISQSNTTVTIVGPMNLVDDIAINPRMSGASTRLLIALAALRSGETFIDGHESLRARTNLPLVNALQNLGCQIDSSDGHLPLAVRGPIKHTRSISIDGSLSSQYITALLLISCGVAGGQAILEEITIKGELVSKPYIDITVAEMGKRGVSARWESTRTISIDTTSGYEANHITIEGDATAASYAASLACIHRGQVKFTNLGSSTHQGDYQFFEILERLGAVVTRNQTSTLVRGPSRLAPFEFIDMQDMPDVALTLIALAPLLDNELSISGLSSLHHKECDRLECPAGEMLKMGIGVKTTSDSIRIQPISIENLSAHLLTTYHDHRMAMAFSLLGSKTGKVTVDDKFVVNKTYPNYWLDYEKLT